MSEPNDRECAGHGQLPARPDDSADFAAPLGSATTGHLVFASGASQVHLQADPGMADFYRLHFERHVPRVHPHACGVTILYPSVPFFDWLVSLRQPLADITLNATIPWEIEFRDGISRLAADLQGLQLRSLDVLGGASHVDLTLSRPAGSAFIHIAGGASHVTIRRPAGVGVRLQVDGGVSKLLLDEQRFGAIGGEMRLETPGYRETSESYELWIRGGASRIHISGF